MYLIWIWSDHIRISDLRHIVNSMPPHSSPFICALPLSCHSNLAIPQRLDVPAVYLALPSSRPGWAVVLLQLRSLMEQDKASFLLKGREKQGGCTDTHTHTQLLSGGSSNSHSAIVSSDLRTESLSVCDWGVKEEDQQSLKTVENCWKPPVEGSFLYGCWMLFPTSPLGHVI